jgi:hypothetical protein
MKNKYSNDVLDALRYLKENDGICDWSLDDCTDKDMLNKLMKAVSEGLVLSYMCTETWQLTDLGETECESLDS